MAGCALAFVQKQQRGVAACDLLAGVESGSLARRSTHRSESRLADLPCAIVAAMSEIAKRAAPKFSTMRDLFVHSGNLCAFPDCDRVLVNHRGQWVGEICQRLSGSSWNFGGDPDAMTVRR